MSDRTRFFLSGVVAGVALLWVVFAAVVSHAQFRADNFGTTPEERQLYELNHQLERMRQAEASRYWAEQMAPDRQPVVVVPVAPGAGEAGTIRLAPEGYETLGDFWDCLDSDAERC